MPIPVGCLAHFDTAVYRPYVKDLVICLSSRDFGWSGPAESIDPPRYCLLRDGIPAAVPEDLRPHLPPPPRVTLEQVLAHFDGRRARKESTQLLDVLTLVSEDLGPARFAAATARRRWVADFMR